MCYVVGSSQQFAAQQYMYSCIRYRVGLTFEFGVQFDLQEMRTNGSESGSQAIAL